MHRLSSSFTIFLKLFIPVFWVVLFTTLGIATILISFDGMGIFSTWQYRLGLFLFLVSGYLILYFTVYKLKRVDADDEYIYISNYFKTYRYPYELVTGYRISDFFIFKTIKLYFHKESTMGKSITFLPSKSRFQYFAEQHSQLRLLED